jgi:Zn-dependent protease with chaperone function
MVLLAAVLIFFVYTPAAGQLETDFTPSPFLDTIPADLNSVLKKRLDVDKARLTTERGKVSNYAGELLEDRLEYLVEYFNRDYFILEPPLTSYLDNILQRILRANPDLPDSILVLPFRSQSANAVNFGNDVIGYMLGLLARTENDDQVAFVICHELAHSYARHSEKKIIAYARLNYDKDVKKQVNEAKRSTYLRYSRLKEIMKGLHLSMNRHSRENESEADSLALVFFLRAGFRPGASLETMDILDKADSDLYQRPLDLRKVFSFREYPFKESWLSYTPPTKWVRSTIDPELDTSRTHPDCTLRKEALRRQLGGLAVTGNDARPPERSTAAMQAQFEIAESAFHFRQYGIALYTSLQLLESHPKNGYLHAMVIKSLYSIYLSQKNHELGKVVTLPDSRFTDAYNRFLTFIHQLRLSEIAALCYHYSISRTEQTFTNEHFLYALWLSAQLEISKLDPVTIKEDYVARYPKGRYISYMKQSSNPKR